MPGQRNRPEIRLHVLAAQRWCWYCCDCCALAIYPLTSKPVAPVVRSLDNEFAGCAVFMRQETTSQSARLTTLVVFSRAANGSECKAISCSLLFNSEYLFHRHCGFFCLLFVFFCFVHLVYHCISACCSPSLLTYANYFDFSPLHGTELYRNVLYHKLNTTKDLSS